VTAAVAEGLHLDPDVMAAAVIVSGGTVEGASERAIGLAAEALAVADRDVMDDIVEALDADYVPSGNTGPRVSDVGSCRRSVWYRESPPQGFVPDAPQYQRQAALGTLIHAKAAEARAARYPWRWYEFEVTVPGLDKRGRVDEYDPVLGEVTDLKSAGSRKWDIVGNEGPAEGAWGQGLLYALTLDEMGLPVQTVRIAVVNRDNGAEEHFRRPYDPAAARAVLDDLVELATMLDIGVVPPRDGLGPRADWQCRSCVARSHCWNIPAAEEAGRSPESFTLLGEDPDEQAIIWAGERKLAATKAKNEAQKEEDVAKALIDGIEGEHGDLVFTGHRRSMPEYKESFERTVQLYDLPEQDRPAAAEVAEPVRRTDRYTTVRRKRAAKRGNGGSR
jgi:CRISPR/Cas system-associated exonuclease Cas4 (RecB family)